MTNRKMNIVLSGTLLIVLMGLFPPWEAIGRTAHPQRHFSGYHFITYSGEDDERALAAPRETTGYASKFDFGEITYGRFNHKIYTGVLLIQWLCVLLLTGSAYLVSDKFGDIKFALNLGGHLRVKAAHEYLYFLKYTVVGVIALPIIRFSYFWLMASEFNWGTFNITGNLSKYYSDSWGYICVPYLLFLLVRSIKWARSELKH